MRLFPPNMRQVCACAMLALFSSAATANIVLNGTRVIYPSDAKDVSFQVNNVGSSSVLLQSWIDDGNADANPETIKVPFFLSPPLSRVEPGNSQILRVIYTGNTLPMNRESLFWLNVLEIPPKTSATADNKHPQVAFRNRIKLFYRPAGLPGKANEAIQTIAWSTQGRNLQANNPTPYYVSLAYLSVDGKKLEGTVVAPRATQMFTLPCHAGSKVSGSFVNDYGSITPFEAFVK